ncbi:MAG TPA: tripartite tricarboxylate transporter substrate-binding protein [Alphaproteobacteria bacterium]|jgi:tripartite-type tricarboxylate transporter receptor subunit TctC|nr:tripartite tricarboxylate transporter substrate-binding protein [Alphaproteobacteria bacterium]
MRLRVLAAAAAAICAAAPAFAQSGADFYKGKTVYLWIGEAAGGDYDTWGRLVGQHIKDHIAGEPTIVAQNVEGAGGLVAINRLANTAAKDGTVFGNVNRGLPFEPLLGGAGAQFDPRKLNWLGSPELDVIVCTARKDAPVQTLEDLKTRELIVGATGTGADTLTYPQFLQGLLGLKFKIVKGFPGSSPIVLATERGEVQGLCNSYQSVTRQAYYREGNLNILFQGAETPDPRLKDVPTPFALATNEDDRQALRLFLDRAAVGRPFVAPGGVPADRIAILRKAFDETVKDPAFIEAAKKAKLNVSPITGEQIAKVIEDAYATPQPVVDRTKKLMGR